MINACCFYSGEGGWARHAQSFLEALTALEPVALLPWDGPIDPASLTPVSRQMLLNGEKADMSDPVIGIGSIEFMEKMHGDHRVAFVVWETSTVPPDKIRVLCGLDEVWTPSEWGRRLLVRNGIPESKVFVVPEGVDAALFQPRDERPQRAFRFLCVGKWEVRKGIDDLVRAYCAEFDAAELKSSSCFTATTGICPIPIRSIGSHRQLVLGIACGDSNQSALRHGGACKPVRGVGCLCAADARRRVGSAHHGSDGLWLAGHCDRLQRTCRLHSQRKCVSRLSDWWSK